MLQMEPEPPPFNMADFNDRYADDTNITQPSLFDTEEPLNTEILHQRDILPQLADNLIAFLRLQRRRHFLIFGGVGTGKTQLIKFILSEAEKLYPFKTHYVNCRKANTTYRVMRQILQERRKLPSDVITDDFQKYLSEGTHTIILDEVDLLKDDDLLYLVSRDIELKKVLLFLITNKSKYYKDNIGDDVKSTLLHDLYIFNEYTVTDLYHIFKKRCDVGLKSYDDEIVLKIAANNFRHFHSDARVGIVTLGRVFGKTTPPKLSDEDLKGIMATQSSDMQARLLESVKGPKREILYLLLEETERQRVLRRYCARFEEISKTHFIRLLSELEKLGLIQLTQTRVGRSTKTIINHSLSPENVGVLKRDFNPVQEEDNFGRTGTD
jgi:Cdc6-like AAA superfamily ATPase